MLKRLWLIALTAGASVCLAQTEAIPDGSSPWATRNQHPLVQVSGLPAAASARLLAPGRWELRLAEDIASHFLFNIRDDERILLDGESYRTTLAVRRAFSPRWQAGVELFYLDHTPGHFDGLINTWHDFFGLPDGNRSDFPKDRLVYRYQRDGVPLLDVTGSRAGAGDIRLLLDYAVLQGPRALALQLTQTLPTARAAALLGSGGANTSLALNWQDDRSLQPWQSRWYAGLGQLWRQLGEILPELQRDQVTFGYLGASYQWSPRLILQAQLDGHTSLYRSDLTELGKSALQLGFGGSLHLADGWLDIAATEDIKVNTAADIALHIGWRRQW